METKNYFRSKDLQINAIHRSNTLQTNTTSARSGDLRKIKEIQIELINFGSGFFYTLVVCVRKYRIFRTSIYKLVASIYSKIRKRQSLVKDNVPLSNRSHILNYSNDKLSILIDLKCLNYLLNDFLPANLCYQPKVCLKITINAINLIDYSTIIRTWYILFYYFILILNMIIIRNLTQMTKKLSL